jgi:hypothetical protein
MLKWLGAEVEKTNERRQQRTGTNSTFITSARSIYYSSARVDSNGVI